MEHTNASPLLISMSVKGLYLWYISKCTDLHTALAWVANLQRYHFLSAAHFIMRIRLPQVNFLERFFFFYYYANVCAWIPAEQ